MKQVKTMEGFSFRKVVMPCVWVIMALVILIVVTKLWEDTDKSKNYVCQIPISGKYEVWTDGGLKFQKFGNLYEYDKTSQVEFTGIEKNEGGYVAVSNNPAAATTFNDRGKGMIIGSLRVVMPTDYNNMAAIQRDFGSQEALMNNLVKPTLYKVVTSCGPLMSSLESVSETRTDLIAYITDQLNDGVYKTRSVRDSAVNDVTGQMELRVRSELIPDPKAPGGYRRQEKSPFAQYGITCNLVSITDIKYDAATQKQIDEQKKANLAVITAKSEALAARQAAIKAEESGKAEATKARWAQEKEKAIAVTKAEQEREVAKLEAEKANFNKARIIAEGEAQAAANRAKVAAGLTPQERAEWEYKTKVGVAEAVSNINLPKIVTTSGNGSSNQAMDAMGLKMLLDIVDKISK